MEIDIHQLERPYAGLRIRDPRQGARWLASLSRGDREGSLGAVLVVPAKAAGRFVLIDGYARVAALERLGRDTVEVIVLPLGEAEALVFALRLATQGRRCALEEGWLLQRVQQETGLGLEALAQRFGRSSSWVSRRLGLVEALPEAVQQAVQVGAIPSRAALRCLVPLARANPAQCCELVAGIAGAELSVRAIERLYVAWREGDGEQRARIVSHPLLYLRAEQAQREAEPPDPGAPTAVEATLQDIDVAGALCRRVRRRLVRGLALPAEAQALFARAWRETRLAFEALGEQLEGVAGAR